MQPEQLRQNQPRNPEPETLKNPSLYMPLVIETFINLMGFLVP